MTLIQASNPQGPAESAGSAEGQTGTNRGPRQIALSAVSAAGTIHDLGNLIQIAASAVNILSRTPDMPADHRGPMLRRARACLDQAGALVRQTLGLARDRIDADRRSSLAACLAGIATLVEALDEPDLVLAIDLEPALPELRCDPIGLQNAVLNLVFNARDAMAGRGLVAIGCSARRHGPAGAVVEIQVTDSGVGMTAATIARAFDPFFTTKTDGLGGVGLTMVERFVRDSGGEIGVDSEPGVGTTVTLRLPARAPADPERVGDRPVR